MCGAHNWQPASRFRNTSTQPGCCPNCSRRPFPILPFGNNGFCAFLARWTELQKDNGLTHAWREQEQVRDETIKGKLWLLSDWKSQLQLIRSWWILIGSSTFPFWWLTWASISSSQSSSSMISNWSSVGRPSRSRTMVQDTQAVPPIPTVDEPRKTDWSRDESYFSIWGAIEGRMGVDD